MISLLIGFTVVALAVMLGMIYGAVRSGIISIRDITLLLLIPITAITIVVLRAYPTWYNILLELLR